MVNFMFEFELSNTSADKHSQFVGSKCIGNYIIL